MEKAILKTLVYADIFDYPMILREIHKWLIGKKATLRQVESAIGRLVQSSSLDFARDKKFKVQSDYYFLRKSNGMVRKRKRREKQSAKYLLKAKFLCQILKIIPWIKLIGISGGLALDNATKADDIDLFIITAKNRLWISRLLVLGVLSLTGQRRKIGDRGKKIAGKICINTLLEEDRLEQRDKDIFVAHEVLQMKVLWQRDNIYFKYLMDNGWALRFLPNWVGGMESVLSSKYYVLRERTVKNRNFHNTRYIIHDTICNTFEKLAKKFQLMIMQKPLGQERIQDGALYFHPKDCRLEVLSKYERKLKTVISP